MNAMRAGPAAAPIVANRDKIDCRNFERISVIVNEAKSTNAVNAPSIKPIGGRTTLKADWNRDGSSIVCGRSIDISRSPI